MNHVYMLVCSIKGHRKFKHRTFEHRPKDHKFTMMEREQVRRKTAVMLSIPVSRVTVERITDLGPSNSQN